MRWPLTFTLALCAWMVLDLAIGRPPGPLEAVAVAGWLISLIWASSSLRSQGFVDAVCRAAAAENRVALTFDDGPDAATTPEVLATLARFDARATFFLVGEKARAEPALVAAMRAAGHELGNHGERHRWSALLTPARARRLIDDGARSIEQAGGGTPAWFRPPYGVATPSLGAAVKSLDVRVAGWSLRSLDTVGRAAPEQRAARLLRQVTAGDILLLHDAPERPGGTVPAGPAMLASLLVGLQERDLEPVTLSELLEG